MIIIPLMIITLSILLQRQTPRDARGQNAMPFLGSIAKRSPYARQTSSPDILACLKYFIPTHATTTHTHAMTAVKMIKAG